MRLAAIALATLLPFGLATLEAAPDASSPATQDVWPGPAPGEKGAIGEEQAKTKGESKTVTSITNVTRPTITVHRPDRSKDTGVAIVVCPGGGYTNLAWDH